MLRRGTIYINLESLETKGLIYSWWEEGNEEAVKMRGGREDARRPEKASVRFERTPIRYAVFPLNSAQRHGLQICIPPNAASKDDWLNPGLDACGILGITPGQPLTLWEYELFRQAVDERDDKYNYDPM